MTSQQFFPQITNDILHALYEEQKLSSPQIASIYGTTSTTILMKLKKNGIPRRRAGESISLTLDRKIPQIVQAPAHLAYIKGVLDGDGSWDLGRKHPQIQMSTHQREEHFALRFASALQTVGLHPHVYRFIRINNRLPRGRVKTHATPYIAVRAVGPYNFVATIEELFLSTKAMKLAYVKGMYDSEGSYSINKRPKGYEIHQLRITNMDRDLLLFTQKALYDAIGLMMTLYDYRETHPDWAAFLVLQDRRKITEFLSAMEEYPE